ncbi:MAG TPA: type II CRISPR-associated endonuclease Cas1 [Lentimicrobium sp.]|nr:type II CRISPR-associated endonuclease Cas1 [Lentimicrobium sp.]
MIKRTIAISNPANLKKKDQQLCIEINDTNLQSSIPIEDIGILILDNAQITITQALISALMEYNAAIIITDSKHLPFGLQLPIFSHHEFTEKMYQQLESSLPLKKNLWQQTIIAKIINQAALLREFGIDDGKLQQYIKIVKSGDPQNVEGRAAAYYWDRIFGEKSAFTRSREGDAPNNLLNYGYAILMAVVARSLTGSGLLPALGIHHRNKYNPWCLANDIMEPYRPYVDRLVYSIMQEEESIEYLSTPIKKKLLQIPVIDIMIEGKSSPLMVGMQRTTASLSACFDGSSRKILYPEL